MIFSGKNILIAYSVIAVLLFLYSFTQVDLGLTLTQASWWQVLQTSFQYVGYFNRPLSAVLYTALVFFMFILYGLLLWLAHQKKLEKKHVWISLLVTGGVLLFSYSAFSYDIFNYIFDAKIVTYYNLNPYVYKALDFPGDPMLSFMHWTHRVYPYGPIWLAVTVPLSFLGFTFFLPTYFLFKALGVASYLGSVYYISKISKKIFPQSEISNMVFFAFNPLVIIESLVSGHNDIFMLFLALWSFSMLLEKKKMFAFVLILFSIGIKFATLFLFPVLLIISFWQKKGKNISWDLVVLFISLCMSIAVVLASIRTNFQPWYLLLVLPFACLLSKKYYVVIPVFCISFFALLSYAPFLYMGNWDPPIPSLLSVFWMSSVMISTVAVFLYKYVKKA